MCILVGERKGSHTKSNFLGSRSVQSSAYLLKNTHAILGMFSPTVFSGPSVKDQVADGWAGTFLLHATAAFAFASPCSNFSSQVSFSSSLSVLSQLVLLFVSFIELPLFQLNCMFFSLLSCSPIVRRVSFCSKFSLEMVSSTFLANISNLCWGSLGTQRSPIFLGGGCSILATHL